MAAPGMAEVPAEISRGWQVLVERAEAETDARVRANLEIVGRHVVEEIAGDVAALLATLVPEPRYLFVTDAGSTEVIGRRSIQALYDGAVASGRNRREFELSLVVADRCHVVTEGTLRQVMPGWQLEPYGIQGYEKADHAGWYLTEKFTAIIWPIDASGLIAGERVYGQTECVVRQIARNEFPLLGPVDRLER